MSSNWKSTPALTLCSPRAHVIVSAACQRLIVVSRGLKELRPMVSTVWPPCWMTASGSSLLASPGSESRAHCIRASLNHAVPMTVASAPLNVRVRTFESPVCCWAFCGPLFSKFLPLKF